MYRAIFGTAVLALAASPAVANWELFCSSPNDLAVRELRDLPEPQFPLPTSTVNFTRAKRPWVSVSLMPDIVTFEEAGFRSGQSYTFSNIASAKGLKGQILNRLGLMEVRSRGFGATFRFSSAPNWAFQFKGTRKFTIAYITQF